MPCPCLPGSETLTAQPELDALIVRNIGDIGAAYNRVKNDIDPRLWVEAGYVVQAAASAIGWNSDVEADECEIWLTHPDWALADGDSKHSPFYVELDEREEPGPDAEWSWLASFTGAWPTRATMGLFIADDRLNHGPWKKRLRNNDAIVDALVAKGFRYDSAGARIYIPFLIDVEELAKAFENDSFEIALQPLAAAVALLETAYTELDNLFRLSID